MKVDLLIKILKQMPKDADVYHLWDGEPRTEIDHVWLSKNGRVVTAPIWAPCYSTENRPVDAPTEKEKRLWYTPEEPQEYKRKKIWRIF